VVFEKMFLKNGWFLKKGRVLREIVRSFTFRGAEFNKWVILF